MLPLPALPASSTLLGASCCAGLLRNTAVGQALSPQMLSFSLCLTLSNLGLMPATSPVYDLVARRLLPLSAALGLLAGARLEGSTGTSRLANRNTAAAASGSSGTASSRTGSLTTSSHLPPMLLAFSVGAVGSVLGSCGSFAVARRCGWSATQAACAAACLCATYVGGSANFFAVAAATGAARQGAILPSLLAADMTLMGGYLLVLTAMAKQTRLQRLFPETSEQPKADHAQTGHAQTDATDGKQERRVVPLSPSSPPPRHRALLVPAAAAATGASAAIACALGSAVESRIHQPGSGILTTSLICLVGIWLTGQPPTPDSPPDVTPPLTPSLTFLPRYHWARSDRWRPQAA